MRTKSLTFVVIEHSEGVGVLVSIELTYNHIRVLEDEPQVPAWNNVKSYQFERVKVVKITWQGASPSLQPLKNGSFFPHVEFFMGIDPSHFRD